MSIRREIPPMLHVILVLALGFAPAVCPQAAALSETTESPSAFVRHIYASYSSKKEPDVLGKAAGLYFSPAVVKLIRRDQTRTPSGYVGKLDFDPICACQDSQGLKLMDLRVKPSSNGAWAALVRLDMPGNRKDVR